MTSTAILIGNSLYEHEIDLACCAHDVAAMKALVEATQRFDTIVSRIDIDADEMRDLVRNALPVDEQNEEVFFYFSGHGAHILKEFYYCGTSFDGDHPNETGVSHDDLLGLIRAASPNVLINVIDACFSGALLIKGDHQPIPLAKEGFRNVLQFSSSRDDQTSMGGEPLSAFTRAFLEASVRKTEGVVYYSDISNTLRDRFLGNEDQTPFFVSQTTGRETLVDDATKLERFRSELETKWGISVRNVSEASAVDEDTQEDEPVTTMQLLLEAEKRMGGSDEANALIGKLFDGFQAKFEGSEYADYFDAVFETHNEYQAHTIEKFMIRVLARESRSDRLVTAEVERKQRTSSPWATATANIMMALNPEWVDEYTLQLNCALDRAQLVLTMVPKYRTLQQLKLVLSCAPSLECCYVFEMVTQHPLTDWKRYDGEGKEVVRRWYKLDWNAQVDWLIEKIHAALGSAIREHVEEVSKRLSDE